MNGTTGRIPEIGREAQPRVPLARCRFELKTNLNIGTLAQAYILNADESFAERIVNGVTEKLLIEVHDTLTHWEGYGRDSVDPDHDERGMRGRATKWGDSGLWEIDVMECP